MLWNALIVLGLLFIINGITISRHTRALETIRKKMGKDTDIYTGIHKGLLFLSCWMSVRTELSAKLLALKADG